MICHRCEHRVRFLTFGYTNTTECGECNNSLTSCRYYIPVKPLRFASIKRDRELDEVFDMEHEKAVGVSARFELVAVVNERGELIPHWQYIYPVRLFNIWNNIKQLYYKLRVKLPYRVS